MQEGGVPDKFAFLGSVVGFARRVLSPAYACRAFTKFGNHSLKGFANAKAKSLAGMIGKGT